jgi:multimeric flavodoxin WrbA
MSLKVVALNGTLKRSSSSEQSSTGRLLHLISEEFMKTGASTETIWLADHDIKPGVSSNEGDGDEWPAI